MNKYLLEIGTEELPYKFIPSAIEQLKTEFAKMLDENKIKYGAINTYASPRRLAVLIDGISSKQEDAKKIVKGPLVSIAYDENGKLSKAAAGFISKNGITEKELFQKDNYIWAEIEQKGLNTSDILKKTAPEIISKIKGAHFMRWDDTDIKFQRPIRWIVSLFNSDTAEFEYAGVKAGNITRGHRFANQKEIVINHPDEYLSKLESLKVYADINKRRELIVKLSKEKAAEAGADAAVPEKLLEEVTFITEYPAPCVCSFDEKYLQIPEKVITTVMAVHQRYFPLYNVSQKGRLLNKFITVSNYTGSDFSNIKAGNERVITARLEDAVFFVREDTQKPLSSYVNELKGITFQKGLGTMYDKTQRIIKLSKYIAEKLNAPDEKIKTIERTAELCKADLASKLVFEFTELQGYIGADYALRSGECEAVSKGIEEHYFPLNADSEPASCLEGQITGIADKIDTITAVFADGRKVSGSADPLGVRRAALGILKTIIAKNLKINLAELTHLAIDNIPLKIDDKQKLYNTIKDFMTDRLIIMLSDKYKNDILEACASNRDVLENVSEFIERLDITKKITARDDYSKFHESINRIIRITKNEKNFGDASVQLFVSPAEKELYAAAAGIDENNLPLSILAEELFKISPLIEEFFDKVLVMDKDEKIKQNRLNLLSFVKKKYDKIADFSRTAP